LEQQLPARWLRRIAATIRLAQLSIGRYMTT
jgi:hypothetical protein